MSNDATPKVFVKPNDYITNMETKQTVSLDGTIIVKYGDKSFQFTGDSLLQILIEKLNSTSAAVSAQFSEA